MYDCIFENWGIPNMVNVNKEIIEELVAKIAAQEAEIERRDAVVLKMAEKYQLVEKDEFAEGLESQAQQQDDTLAFMQPKKDSVS